MSKPNAYIIDTGVLGLGFSAQHNKLIKIEELSNYLIEQIEKVQPVHIEYFEPLEKIYIKGAIKESRIMALKKELSELESE